MTELVEAPELVELFWPVIGIKCGGFVQSESPTMYEFLHSAVGSKSQFTSAFRHMNASSDKLAKRNQTRIGRNQKQKRIPFAKMRSKTTSK
jgi:hypothetical protein